MSSAKEGLVQCLTGLIVLWGSKAAWDLLQEVLIRREQRPDIYDGRLEVVPVLGIAVVLSVVQQLFRMLFAPVARGLVPKKTQWTESLWGLKIDRCCVSVFRALYYSAITGYGLMVLRGKPWLPAALGGTGDTRNCWTDGYPFQALPDDLRRLYLTAMGYHVSELALLLLEARRPDFREMFLHHLVTCALVVLSYMANAVRIGSLGLLLHSLTDVLIYASKAVVDTHYTKLIVASYFALLISYAWLRVFVFPLHLLRSTWVESIEVLGREGLQGWGFFNFALLTLFFLHVYWFGLILKMGRHFARTGHARDMQSNLSSIDLAANKKAS